jgi:hypothetical protein
MPELRAAAAVREIATGPGTTPEAPLRTVALALESDGVRLCLACTDSMLVPDDVLARVSAQVPATNLLITATHTHHAPCTIDILGAHRDAAFCEALEAALIATITEACQALSDPASEAEMHSAQSQEATVGENSRYLLRDGTIAWYAYPWDDVIRPTGPYDPDLPVIALRRPSGEVVCTLFSHSVHNIGALTRGAVSPGMYGLAAQEIERRHGGLALFLPGAFGSTHNTSEFGSTPNTRAIGTAECVHRIVAAVEWGLAHARGPRGSGSQPLLAALRRPFAYRVREFHEADEEAAVRFWSETYTPQHPDANAGVFRAMRAEMAPLMGELRETSLTVMRLGDVDLVGLPGEIFAALALEIRRRSPFRNTYVVGLANGTLGYVGDRSSYALGGYQLWAGWHSLSAPGTGEAMVEHALEMLAELQLGQRAGA